ncbi:MAG: VPS10 domain-containing protein [Acidobacteriota bacterium]
MPKHSRIAARAALWIFLILTTLCAVAAATEGPIDVKLLERLEWRSIGPANMGGRTADVEGVPGNPNLVYVATASGGLWKTANGGVTWKPIFERQNTISLGDIALDPSSPNVIWAGTGESNTRNSVSFGDGVYKSNDGGTTWQHLGLGGTERISRILVHPRNSDIAWVGALGHAFAPNDERGVFMTTDGGKSWQKTLYIDAEHGVADMDIDASNPNILYAAMWSFERKPWTFRSGSEKGGVFKSIDGGRTWKKRSSGLPALVGRIGVKVAPSNGNVVYVIAESKEGTLYRSDDGAETFREVSRDTRIVSRGFYYTDLRVDPADENRIYAVASTLFVSIDGGRSFRSITGRTHIDYHALWIDPKNPERMWQGQDGGIAVSYDRGETWETVNNIPLGQFYHVHADNRSPFYWVMGGLQDNGSWTGPSRTREPAGILNDDWRMVSFGDGFGVINHADDPEIYLSESQGGFVVRTDFRSREQQLVRPYAGGGGGPASDSKYRFHWDAPLALSPHDKNTVYLGGNVVFKSKDFGKTWEKISPDLTTNDPEKQKAAGGPIAEENTSAEYHCTIISLAESPARAGVLWAGTDDGNLQSSQDGGKNWTNLIEGLPGVPKFSPVSHVEPSRAAAATAYVSFDRHMFDDFRPYIFKTTDGGRTWANISGNLPPSAYVLVVREDPKNPGLVYAGTELGLFASYDGGTQWVSLGLKNLPNVAIHDIVVHPRENDLILATHGRSLWILDDATALQQLNAETLSRDAHLFDIRPALRFTTRFTRYGIGDKLFTGSNPPYGALITYYLKEKQDEKATLKLQVFDAAGKLVREVNAPPREAGLNRVAWDLRYEPPAPRRTAAEPENPFTGGPRGPQVLPGVYTVKLLVGDRTLEETVEVRVDPGVAVTLADLRAQFDHGMRLRDMQSSTNRALRALDSIRDQIQQIEKAVKDRLTDPPKELTELLADHGKQAESLQNRLASPQEGLGYRGRSQLAEKISGLFFSIDGVHAAPTPALTDFFAEVQSEFRERMTEVNRFLEQTIPTLNESLRRHDAPTILAGKKIE